MSNSLLTISQITKESLRVLKNQIGMTKSVNRQYDDSFAKSGAKIGDTINIRKPNRFTVSSGQTLSLQDVTEASTPLVLDSQKHVDFQFSSKDMTLSIDEFSKRYVVPAMTALANDCDFALTGLYKQISQSVGTPGTSMATLTDALAAKRKLAEAGCPVDSKLSMMIDAEAEASIVDGLKGLFQSSNQIKEQYEKGMMGRAAGFGWSMDQNIRKHTVGAYAGTPLVNGGSQTGAALITDGWSSGASALVEGDVFTIAGVYAINQQNRESTGQLKEFVVTAGISDTSGAKTIAISPSIVTSGALQNVNAGPADNAAITVKGAASGVFPQQLAFHEDAFVLGCADLVLPGGVDMASRASDSDSGLSLRLVRDYDISNDRFPCRIDLLYGVKAVYPELACRIYN